MDANLAQQVEKFIKDMVRDDSEGLFQKLDGTPMYEEPIVGFASGTDPLFEQYKKIIGGFHLTPVEFLEKVAADQGKTIDIQPEKCTVICWSLPIAKNTRNSNRKEKDVTSEKWAHT